MRVGATLICLLFSATASAREQHPSHHHDTSKPTLRERRDAVQAALRAHQAAAAKAAAHHSEIARKAAALAQQQVKAAAALRGLEDQTAQDTSALAQLQAQQAQEAAKLNTTEAMINGLLPVIQRLASAPATTLLVAPLSPQDSVHGIAILQGLTAELGQQANLIKIQTAALAVSIKQAQTARVKLNTAVSVQQAAEASLNRNIKQARKDELADANQEAVEAAQAAKALNDLTSLNAAIARLVPKAPPHAAHLLPGGAGAPVAGHVIIAYGQSTPAGPSTGISYATAPGAIVTSPCHGIILYAGPLTGYGTVVIAGCGNGIAAVLAGMNSLDVSQGQHIVHGQPVGNMLSFNPAYPTNQPHLYVELRQNGTPIDPTSWLASRHSG